MMIRNGDGTSTAGPLDVLCILHNVDAGTYHAAFFEEKPMPGPVPEVSETSVVRLKSRMHHTIGATSLEGAIVHLDELAAKILVPEENVWRDPQPWDGLEGIVWVLENWRAAA